MKTGVIILAAGKGERFHGKKQNLNFHGKPLWKHVYDTSISIVPAENIVIVGRDILGGETRSESVVNGLKALSKETDRVVIVEAARPLVTKKQLEIILNDTAKSSSFVMPLVNTPIGRDGTYYERNAFYELLVPQACNYKMLLKAYETGKYKNMTDETKVMFEEYEIKPHLIETGQNLFKVTYPRDVATLEMIYQNLKGEYDV